MSDKEVNKMNLDETKDVFSNDEYRIEVKPDFGQIPYWIERGYALADRTVQVSVSLKKSKVDFAKHIRMNIVYSKEHKEEIRQIARSSFLEDTRFCVTIPPDEQLIQERINTYLTDKEQWFLCQYKGRVIGFIVPEIQEEGRVVSVYLAAVEERYRITGAAMSLYHYVAQYYKELGYEKMVGRISSRNTAVTNVWTSLGATFSEPRDIYLLMR